MAQESIKNLKKRIEKAEAIKEDRRSLDESAYEIAMPQRNLYTKTNQGDSRMNGVYTSMGMSTVNNFVNNMQNSLTPPFTRWAQLQAGDAVGEDQEGEFNEVLEKLTEKIFSFLDASNFATASSEMYFDLVVGTGALLINKGEFDKPLNFTAVPTAQLALEEGVFGDIGGIFRKHKIPARLIEHTWTDAKIPPKMEQMIKDKPTEDIILDEVTYHDMDSDTWYYEILWMDSGREEERLVTRVTKYNPWVIVRWSKIAGEVFGRGLLLQALPDLKMLNHGQEMAAVSVQMNAFGSYTMEEDGILNTDTAEINPAGILVVKKNSGGGQSPSIDALPRVGDSRAQEFFFTGLEDNIKKIMMDNKLPDQTAAVRSPTEIVERIKEFQADFGAAFGRLMHEYVNPLFKTVIQILDEAGAIEVPVIKIGDEKKKITDDVAFTKIKMLAPVAKSQALEDVQSVVQSIQMAQGIEPRLPLVGYKVEELPKFFAEKLGMPTELVRSTAEQEQAMGMLTQILGGQEAAQGAPPA